MVDEAIRSESKEEEGGCTESGNRLIIRWKQTYHCDGKSGGWSRQNLLGLDRT